MKMYRIQVHHENIGELATPRQCARNNKARLFAGFKDCPLGRTIRREKACETGLVFFGNIPRHCQQRHRLFLAGYSVIWSNRGEDYNLQGNEQSPFA